MHNAQCSDALCQQDNVNVAAVTPWRHATTWQQDDNDNDVVTAAQQGWWWKMHMATATATATWGPWPQHVWQVKVDEKTHGLCHSDMMMMSMMMNPLPQQQQQQCPEHTRVVAMFHSSWFSYCKWDSQSCQSITSTTLSSSVIVGSFL